MKASFHDLHSQCAFLDAVLQYLYTSDPQVNHVLNGCRQGEAKQDWRAADECVVYKEVATFTSLKSKITNTSSGQAGKERVDVYPKGVFFELIFVATVARYIKLM